MQLLGVASRKFTRSAAGHKAHVYNVSRGRVLQPIAMACGAGLRRSTSGGERNPIMWEFEVLMRDQQ